LARLLCANVIAFRFSVSVAVGFDQAVRGDSCLVCQRQFAGEENSKEMVTHRSG